MKKRIIPALLAFGLALGLAFVWQSVYRDRFLKVIYPRHYSALVQKYSSANRLDPDFVYAVIKNESGFNPRAASNAGAMGLMQLTPETYEWAKSKTSGRAASGNEDLFDPETNIRYGTSVLSLFSSEFDREDTALAAYHAGRGKVNIWLKDLRYSKDGRTLSHIPYDDTRAYVRNVLRTEQIYKTLYG